MKTKYLFLLAAIAASMMLSISARSQVRVGDQKVYYIEVFELYLLTTKSVSVNYGITTSFSTKMKITTDNDEIIKFDNAIGALNYLSSYGWELVSTYTKDSDGSHNSTHYLMKLDTNIHPADRIARQIDEILAQLKAEPAR